MVQGFHNSYKLVTRLRSEIQMTIYILIKIFILCTLKKLDSSKDSKYNWQNPLIWPLSLKIQNFVKSTYSQDHLSMKHRLSWLVVERKYRLSSEQLALTPRYMALLVLEVYLYVNFPAVFFSSLNKKSWLVAVSHADCSYKNNKFNTYM